MRLFVNLVSLLIPTIASSEAKLGTEKAGRKTNQVHQIPTDQAQKDYLYSAHL